MLCKIGSGEIVKKERKIKKETTKKEKMPIKKQSRLCKAHNFVL